MMTTSDLLELAAIEGAITRTIAMKEACVKWSAPTEAVEYLDSQLRTHWNDKQLILSRGVQPDYDHLERKAALVGQLLEALDPDQSDNVSWWAI